MSDHITDPGQHRTLFYGHYANRIRGARGAAPDEAPVQANQDHPLDPRPPDAIRFLPRDPKEIPCLAYWRSPPF